MTPLALFGRDHWSTFGYIETRVVDHGGVPDKRHMRCDPDRHPAHVNEDLRHLRSTPCPPTRLLEGVQEGHDDWDCAEDLEATGLLQDWGTGLFPVYVLTEEGFRVAALLRAHKARGGAFSSFRL